MQCRPLHRARDCLEQYVAGARRSRVLKEQRSTQTYDGPARVKAYLIAVRDNKALRPDCNWPVDHIVRPRMRRGALMRWEAITAVRHQIPKIFYWPNESQRIETGDPIAVQIERNDGCDQCSRDTQDPRIRPLPGLMEACCDIEALPKIGVRSAQRETDAGGCKRSS